MNLSFRKHFLSTVGELDESFIGYGCEDIEFGHRITQAGYFLKRLNGALAVHREDSSNICQYGIKLYKTGLYGRRTLARVCPDAEKLLERKIKCVGGILGNVFVSTILEKYLVATDSIRFLYSYKLYKAYLYSRLYKGIKDQKNISELNIEEASKGW